MTKVDFGGLSPPSNKKPTYKHYVYILKCSDDSFYTGCTNDLKERLDRHQKGLVHYTKNKLPVELHTCIAFKDKFKAFNFEKYLKTGSGRAFASKHFR